MGDSISHELEDVDIILNSELEDVDRKMSDIHLLVVYQDCESNEIQTHTTSIQIGPTATIRQLKSTVAMRFETDADSFTLYLPGLKPLFRDHLTLSDYSITDGQILSIRFQIYTDSVYIAPCFEPSMDWIYYNGGTLSLQNRIDSCRIVCDLKALIEELHSIPRECQILYFKGNSHKTEPLTDHQVLSDRVVDAAIHLKDAALYLEVDSAYRNVLSLVQPIEYTAAAMNNEYLEIRSHFCNTIQPSMDIVNTYKIEKNLQRNLLIYDHVMNTMDHQTEKILFHGTSMQNIEQIILNGFNRDYNKRSAFGKGTYFAKYARTAAGYSKKNETSKVSAMLVCKVIVGNYGLCTRKEEKQWDSFVDDVNDPTIFVVNRDYHAVPLYIITFKKRRKHHY